MLDELRIRGLGVIEEAVLPLGPGLTVVTGETGAGKTMVVTGLLLLFGGRADSARVRTGAERASVDGRLHVEPDSSAAARVRNAGGDLDDETDLVLRRVVNANGRSRAFVGGAAAPVGVLAELAEDLLAVHGQADQQRLVQPSAQRAALDRYAGIELDPFTQAYGAWRVADAELTDRSARSAELRRESELLARGIAEIEAAAPQPDEAHALTALAARLGHADALTFAARAAHDALVGDVEDPASDTTDVSQLLAAASRGLSPELGADPALDGLAERLTELAALATDLAADFGAYAAGLETDPARLEQVEQRRAKLSALVRTYCDEPDPSLVGVLRWADAAQLRLSQIDVSDDAIARLRALRDNAAAQLAAAGRELSARRRAAASRLATAATAELAGLAMAGARLEVSVSPRAATGPGANLELDGRLVGVAADGFDEVQLLLAAHAGAPALPLGRGASGGELSRVMLALEVCLADTGAASSVPTLVFDEVDAGVGGRAAVEVGRRLALLARDRQVLVVTHLAQVAAFADRHVVVDKPMTGHRAGGGADSNGHGEKDSGAVVASDVRMVTDDARLTELARMLGGADTATAREHAAELVATSSADRTGATTSASVGALRPTARRRGPKRARVPGG